ncbi:hypothetical protein V6N11_015575 [Hibiscus sabdariffa]|uniref:CASP-like protein n=1 Tax=Hibiscus sabdariffa TaxID=183260 RepID=A0ABR2TT23_9ROSI
MNYFQALVTGFADAALQIFLDSIKFKFLLIKAKRQGDVTETIRKMVFIFSIAINIHLPVASLSSTLQLAFVKHSNHSSAFPRLFDKTQKAFQLWGSWELLPSHFLFE